VVPPHPKDRRSQAFLDIRAALAETELEVLDKEVLTIRPHIGPEHWLPLFELGCELGDRFVNVSGETPSLTEFSDKVSQLAIDAHSYGLQPVLEPVAFRDLNNFDVAVSIARETGVQSYWMFCKEGICRTHLCQPEAYRCETGMTRRPDELCVGNV
jgi:hypothetical protein